MKLDRRRQVVHAASGKGAMAQRALAALVVVLGACTTAPALHPRRAQEIDRVHAHLARVEAELVARAVDGLSPRQRAARATVLAKLHADIAARVYPTNDVAADPTPIFLGRDGGRRAMATLIEAGGGALVARVARIQPQDPSSAPSRWMPTLSIVGAADAGGQLGGDAAGGQLWLNSAIVRAGFHAGLVW